jgi:transcription initiation factor TFIID TATA-box-binding protein
MSTESEQKNSVSHDLKIVIKSNTCSSSNSNNTSNKINENELELTVNNVVCSYSTKCHLNLRRIAMEGLNVEYKKENNMVNMKLKKPNTTATIWSSGKITCTGATTESDAYKAARRYCRLLQKMKFKIRLSNYRVVNVLATCCVPFMVDIFKIANDYQKECSYEPELHPGATFKIKDIKCTLKLFTTGSITLTGPSVKAVEQAISFIYPILCENKRNNSTESTISISNCNLENNNYNNSQQTQIPTSKPPVLIINNQNAPMYLLQNSLNLPNNPLTNFNNDYLKTADTFNNHFQSQFNSVQNYHNYSGSINMNNNGISSHNNNFNSSNFDPLTSNSNHIIHNQQHNNNNNHVFDYNHHHNYTNNNIFSNGILNGVTGSVVGSVGPMIGMAGINNHNTSAVLNTGLTSANISQVQSAPPAFHNHNPWFSENVLVDNMFDDFLQ